MDHLPNELLELIGQYINDQPTKRALSNCSHQFQCLFEPLLYSSINCSSIALVQHLWYRPDLARRVQHAEFNIGDCYGNSHLMKDSDDKDLNSALVEQILNEIFDTEDEKFEYWLHLRHSCMDVWLGVLFIRLCNLKSITIMFGLNPNDMILKIIERAALHQRPFHQAVPFPFLEIIKLRDGYGDSWIDSDFATSLSHFPAVRIIDAQNLEECMTTEDTRCWHLTGIKNPACSVTHIVPSPAYNCNGLTDWVAACSKLEHSQVSIGAGPQYSTAGYIFDPKEFCQSLLSSKDTLKTFSLSFCWSYHIDRDNPYAPSDVTEDLLFGSFKAFHVLEHLSIQHANLVRLPGAEQSLIDLLPSSLKSLKVTEIAEELVPDLILDLLALVKLHKVSIPHLESIMLDVILEGEPTGAVMDSIGVLVLVFEDMGVCLSIRVRQSKDLAWPSSYEGLELAISSCT